MFRSIVRLGGVALVIAMVMTACSTDTPTTSADEESTQIHRSGEPIPGQYIVIFDDASIVQKGESLQDFSHAERADRVQQLTNRIADQINISTDQIQITWGSALRGAVLTGLNQEQVDKLNNDSRVRRIEQDVWVSLPPFQIMKDKPSTGGSTPTQPAQSTPWGITKVGGAETPSGDNVAWIIDTGIDVDHPDLNVLASMGRDFTSARKKSVDDGNGHGTHTAGTVGAIDNSIGVIGVAPGIGLVPMKCLGSNGSGQFSWSISCFNYVAANGNSGDVVNDSVGPGSRYTLVTLDEAVEGVAAQGIKVAMAAGNSDDDCFYYSPARVNGDGIYTIAAMTSSTAKASYSNYGTPVDFWEPGSGVYSTYKGGTYATASGTSMASPHACGMLAVGGITSGGTVSGVPSGTTENWGKRD